MDMIEYRALTSAETETFDRIRQYAFHPQEGPPDSSDDTDNSEMGDRYGLFDGGELVSVCLQYDFEARLRGEWIDLAGLGTVATAPEHRRQGYAGELIRESIRSFAAQGRPLVTLWPFETGFYRQFGFSPANTVTHYECAPSVLTGLGEGNGEFKPVGPSEWQSLSDVHLTAGEGETLSRRLREAWWRRRVFREWGEDRRHVYRYDRGGMPAGYLADAVEDSELAVAEMGAVDHDAYRELLGFLGRHGPQIEQVAFERAGDSSLLHLVPEPEALECTIEPGPMVRATAVEMALAATPYRDGTDAAVTVAVTDPLTPDEAETYRLDVRDGSTSVQSTPAENPDLTIDVGTLSRLIVGALDVPAAEKCGDLAIESAAVRSTVAELFPAEQVYLREFF